MKNKQEVVSRCCPLSCCSQERQQRNHCTRRCSSINRINGGRIRSCSWPWIFIVVSGCCVATTLGGVGSSSFYNDHHSNRYRRRATALWTKKPKQREELDLLLVGNSYTQANDLEGMVRALLLEGLGIPQRDDSSSLLHTKHYARGAATLHDFVVDKRKELEKLIKSGADGASSSSSSVANRNHNDVNPNNNNHNNWTWVVLQEQSQTPGLYEGNVRLYDNSMVAIQTLYDWISRDGGGQTVLLMTWGRLHSDSMNPGLYPDYATMQNKLTEGYLRYQRAINDAIIKNNNPTNSSSPPQQDPRRSLVRIAPAGLAFRAIHEDSSGKANNGTAVDPTKPGTRFFRLYARDGNHPSPEGTYLVACVLYATLTGRDPKQLKWKPPLQHPGFGTHSPGGSSSPQMDDETRDYLQGIAYKTVRNFQPELLPKPQTIETNNANALSGGGVVSSSQNNKNSSLFLVYYCSIFVSFSLAVLLLYFVLSRRKQQRNELQQEGDANIELEKLMRTNIRRTNNKNDEEEESSDDEA